MKKVLSIALVFAIMLPLFTFSASAENEGIGLIKPLLLSLETWYFAKTGDYIDLSDTEAIEISDALEYGYKNARFGPITLHYDSVTSTVDRISATIPGEIGNADVGYFIDLFAQMLFASVECGIPESYSDEDWEEAFAQIEPIIDRFRNTIFSPDFSLPIPRAYPVQVYRGERGIYSVYSIGDRGKAGIVIQVEPL